jgi:hypothetical protein
MLCFEVRNLFAERRLGYIQRGVGRRESKKDLTVHVFHSSVHRYFVFTLRIALTSMKRLFNLAGVDG